MNVVCDFTDSPSLSSSGSDLDTLTCFLPIMGKPFLHHLLGYIARLGAKHLAIFLSDNAEKFEQFIGDGERWGITVTYHLVKRGVSVRERVAKSSPFSGDEPVLWCNARYLPCLKETHLKDPARFLTRENEDTGWFYSNATDPSSLPSTPLEALCVADAKAYLKTVENVLSRNGGTLIVLGKELREGVWVGAGTKMHPSCTIIAPVYIGSQVNLGENTVIGPRCEIGNGCIIDDGSSIIESSVLSGSYVGKNLEVRRCVVNQNTIFNVALDSAYVASDAILTSSVEQEERSGNLLRVSVASRFIAFFLALLTSPILLVLLGINRFVYRRKREKISVLAIPQIDEGKKRTITISTLRRRSEKKGGIRWHARWIFLLGLWQVVLGKARFCGVPFRTTEDFEKLSKEWQQLYLSSKPGIITEADILYEEYPEEEMLFSSEMYYHVVDSFSYNAKLIARYIKGLFR